MIKQISSVSQRGLIVMWACLFASSVTAQNSTLVGGDSFARECYLNSQSAALQKGVNRLDTVPCNRAIDDAGLNQADLLASLVNRGIIFTAIGDYVSAAKDYNRALEINPEVGEAYLNRGNLWFLAQRYQAAIDDYDDALKFGVKEPHVAYLNRGMVLEKVNDRDAAKLSYQRALELVEAWEPAKLRLKRLDKLPASD
ncbi:tetratricopeptide repeat protein [Arenicella xantha]|uniref:Tetratricopeptide repeat protein n=1 Tax=Arenicella xantha TaxID=644221 RepID=A0A395JGE1_9GAMM|nr:tetratricopeptide repeat protein [Arenicella xantha]RBP48852.1 tetratricopeptide repeat protein [Arenicella xantha]